MKASVSRRIRTLFSVAVVVVCVGMLTGCYSVKLAAPPGGDVSLMAPGKSASFKKTQRNWYVLWGLVPVYNDGTQKVIKDNGLTEVRFETKMTFLDWLITGVLSIGTVATTSSIIEGNAE